MLGNGGENLGVYGSINDDYCVRTEGIWSRYEGFDWLSIPVPWDCSFSLSGVDSTILAWEFALWAFELDMFPFTASCSFFLFPAPFLMIMNIMAFLPTVETHCLIALDHLSLHVFEPIVQLNLNGFRERPLILYKNTTWSVA